MRRYNFKNEISYIDYFEKLIDKFKIQSGIFIVNLKTTFEKHELITSDISDNSFEFKFWGLNFISKNEISFDIESKTFKNGELNTYLKIEKKLIMILTYRYDSIGNIGDGCMQDDFADFYYIDFVNSLIKICDEKKIKFQLG